jgi:hypothetical protein
MPEAAERFEHADDLLGAFGAFAFLGGVLFERGAGLGLSLQQV